MKKKFVRGILTVLCGLTLFGMGKLDAQAITSYGDGYITEYDVRSRALRQYLFEHYDANQDKYLSKAEFESVTTIDVNGCGISYLTGIEHMPNLKTLDCRNNLIEELDVSNNPNLTSLKCSHNYIKELDVSLNTKLKTLQCSYNYLETLNLTKNTALTTLYYTHNNLGILNLAKNTALTTVTGGKNRYYIQMKKNSDGTYSCDLSNLPATFTASKASGFSVGKLDGTVLTVPAGTKEVTFQYQMNGSYADTFTLDCFYSVSINAKNFPDALFREYVKGFDANENGSISCAEAKTVTDINLRNENAENLKGIETFVYLEYLNAEHNELQELDLSANKRLNSISLRRNYSLANLTLGSQDYIYDLDLYGAEPKKIDFTKMPALRYLSITCSKLNTLDLSQCTHLWRLTIESYETSKFDFSGFSELEKLVLYNCKSEKLLLGNIPIESLEIHETETPKVDVSGCKKLKILFIYDSNIKELVVGANPNLERFTGSDNEFETADFSGATGLTSLQIEDNPSLKTLLLPSTTTLPSLDCSGCSLTTLDISPLTGLTKLDCSSNKLSKLDISKNKKLIDVNCSFNAMTSFSAASNTKLESLELEYCQNLTSLKISKTGSLKLLDISDSGLKNLDVSNCISLETLDASMWRGDLNSVNVAGCSNLQNLILRHNSNLKELDLSTNENLEKLEVEYTGLASIDLSKNTKLVYLDVCGTKIPTLNVSHLKKLEYLSVGDSFFKHLTLGKLPCLKTLKVYGHLVCLDASGCPALENVNQGNIDQWISVKKDAKGQYFCNLKDYDASFDSTKVSNVVRGSMNGSVLTADPGENSVEYDYALGNGHSITVSIEFFYLPMSFEKDAENVSAKIGEQVTLSVKVADAVNPTYQWMKITNGYSWEEGVRCSSPGAKTDTLTLTAKESYNDLLFYCMVLDVDGSELRSEIVKVFCYGENPLITYTSYNFANTAGTNVTFRVTAYGDEITYQWQKSTDNGITWSNCSSEGAKTDSLKLTIKESYSGWLFRCVVKDKQGDITISSNIPANVYPSPYITGHPVDTAAYVGDTAEFTVDASGCSTIIYQWMKSTDGGKTWVKSSSEGAASRKLRIPVKASYNGLMFKCVTADERGVKAETTPAKLTVLSRITAQPADCSAKAGETAQFRVAATGAGLTYQWKKSTDGGKTWVNSSSEGAKTNTLTMTTKASYNGLQFKCIVTDQDGNSVESNAVALTVN